MAMISQRSVHNACFVCDNGAAAAPAQSVVHDMAAVARVGVRASTRHRQPRPLCGLWTLDSDLAPRPSQLPSHKYPDASVSHHNTFTSTVYLQVSVQAAAIGLK